MKMTVSILLMMIAGIVNAQTFFFNQLITIEKIGNDQKKGIQVTEIQKLINASNSNYVLEFKSDSIAKLREYSSKRYHDFKIQHYTSIGDLQMMYARTCDETELMEKYQKDNQAERTELIKIGENEFEYNSYKKANSKKPFRQLKFKLEESASNQLEVLANLSEDLKTELSQHLDSTKFYTMKEISFWTDGELHQTYRLKSTDGARLKIILPGQLKFECLNPFLGIK